VEFSPNALAAPPAEAGLKGDNPHPTQAVIATPWRGLGVAVFLLFLLLPLTIFAQQECSNGVVVKNAFLELSKDQTQLQVSLIVDIANASVPSREALVLTPVVKTKEKTFEFPPIAVQGRNHSKVNERTQAFGGALSYKTPQLTIMSDEKENSQTRYVSLTKFEPWMKEAQLELCEETHGCAGCTANKKCYSLGENLIGEPVPNFITPKAEEVKNREKTGKAYLEFPAGESTILPKFRRNAKELSKISRAINLLSKDSNAIVTNISLRGYASPEDSYAWNNELSEKRTQALKRYLQRQLRYDDELFEVGSGGEDWEGLRKLVASSKLRDKRAILAIINSENKPDAKEQRLKRLKGGAVYRQLFTSYFPKLRRVDYALHHTIRAFTVEEGKEKIKTAPEQLSLNEMFLVANSYGAGTPEFNHVFEVAIKVFPKDTTANINVAAVAISKKDFKTAHRHLDAYADVPEAWNNLGALYMLEKKYPKAEEFLTKAKEQGTAEQAEGNLILLGKWKKKK
jgi:outer membrane protein OmpA-like peptidoglycan-associated protein